MQYRESSERFFAGFGVRFAAYLIDSLLVGAALLIVRIPYFFSALANPDSMIGRPVFFRFSPFDILIYLLSTLYFVLTLYFTGTTPGKKFFSIKVVMADGSKITFINALYRETIGKYLSWIIIFIGYLMIAIDDEKRALHDRLCDTRVVYGFKESARLPRAAAAGRYAQTWLVREEFIEEYLKSFVKPSPELLEEQRKAGLTKQEVFHSGNQFVYLYECGNIDFADHYLNNSPIYNEWKNKIAGMIYGSFDFKKAEAVI